jgi:hypothetical protein
MTILFGVSALVKLVIVAEMRDPAVSPMPIAVESRTSLMYREAVPAVTPLATIDAVTKILLVVADGVIETVMPVMSVNAPVVDDENVSVLLVLTTCKIRNAPRKSFNCAAVKTLPLTNAAGKVVGVAISVTLS